MLRVIEYKGAEYPTKSVIVKGIFSNKRRQLYRDDYIRFEWDNGHLDMTKYHWDKLSKKKKNLIYKLAKGESA